MIRTDFFILTWNTSPQTGYMDDPSDEPYDGFDHTELNPSDFALSRGSDDLDIHDPENLEYVYLPKAWGLYSGNYALAINRTPDLEGDFTAVYIIYGDGGTFGRTDGYVRFVGACHVMDTARLELLKQEANSINFGYFGSVQSIEVRTFYNVKKKSSQDF